jgi:hypothetical protein
MASLIAFFTNLWGGNTATANPSASEKLGFQYFYDEDGSLMYELGCGGANSTGAARYVYLPTTGKKRCVDQPAMDMSTHHLVNSKPFLMANFSNQLFMKTAVLHLPLHTSLGS